MSSKGSASSINDAVKHVSAASLTFLLTTTYLGITAFSITHEQLLIGHRVTLPLLSVEVSVRHFFIMAPIMAVLFHLVFLVQVYLLAKETRSDLAGETGGDGAGDRDRTVLLPTIFVQVFDPRGFQTERKGGDGKPRTRRGLWLLMRALLAVILVVLPLALLGIIQARFVPYHDPRITLLHQALIVADVAACLWLVPFILAKKNGWCTWWCEGWIPRKRRPWGSRALFVLVLVLSLAFAWGVAVVPGTFPGSVCDRWKPPLLCFDRDLRLSGIDLGGEEVELRCPPEKPPRDLSGRDLRGADLSHSRLVGVDFRGANLRGATLVRADLRCADFSPGESGELIAVRPEERARQAVRLDPAGVVRADLRGVDLSRADLRGAWLELADLRGANLKSADLRGAQGVRADLRGTILREARMAVSDFSHARLDGAALERSDALCADLHKVSARGVLAREVTAEGANLQRADLSGAMFAEGRLFAADFTDARLSSGDLRGARLPSSRALDLAAVDLRRAEVGGATATLVSDEQPYPPIDAREVTTGGASAEERARASEVRGEMVSELAGFELPLTRWRSCVNERLGPGAAPGAAPVAGAPGRRPLAPIPVQRALSELPWVLRDPVAESRAVTPGLDSEQALHQRRVRAMIRDACEALPLAAQLVLRAKGCLPPRDEVQERHLLRELEPFRERPELCTVLSEVLALTDSLVAPPKPGPESVNRFGIAAPEWDDPGLAKRACEELSRTLREKIAAEP